MLGSQDKKVQDDKLFSFSDSEEEQKAERKVSPPKKVFPASPLYYSHYQ
jgi:hypothetical protein